MARLLELQAGEPRYLEITPMKPGVIDKAADVLDRLDHIV